MPAELSLLDTNVLVYSVFGDSEKHIPARRLLEQAGDAAGGLCVCSQVLAEFFAVVTDPRRVSAPRQPEEALAVIEAILSLPGITLLPTPAETVHGWVALVRRQPVTGGRVFDAQLAATMLANGVIRIHTFNRADFARFSELEVITPE